jgi:hypothetical protein
MYINAKPRVSSPCHTFNFYQSSIHCKEITMQAIQVKYICPTNTKDSRIKAFCAAGSLTIAYPLELSGQAVYRKAAEALAIKLGWVKENAASYGDGLLGGCLPNGDYCFVFNNDWAKE